MRSGAPRGAEERRRSMPPQSRPDPQTGFGRSTSGSVAVQVALLLLLVLGFIALGVEVSQLLLEHRKQQSAADSAAVTAASAKLAGIADLRSEARAVAASQGYNDAANDVAVTVDNPPSGGTYAGNSQYIEVKVERTFTPGLIQLFRQGAFTVRARATAKAAAGSSACMMALDTSADKALELSNNASINLPGCGLIVNSTSNSAIRLENNATVTGNVTVAGAVSKANNAVVNGTVTTAASAGSDPYAGVSPSRAGLTDQDTTGPTLKPGIYKNGWDLSNGFNKPLEPGLYFIKSKFVLKNNVTLTGTGVTIIVDGDYDIDIGNNVTLTLSAPTSGVTSGIVLYSSSNNNTVIHKFNNNTTLNLTGALYFRNQTVRFMNNVITNGSLCTQVVARKIQLQNNAAVTLNSSCSGTGTSTLGSGGAASLVE